MSNKLSQLDNYYYFITVSTIIIIIIIITVTIFLDLLGLNINWDIVLFSSPKKFIEKKNSNFGHAVSYLGLPCVFFEKL